MVESWAQHSASLGIGRSELQDGPVLVVPVGVADQGVQQQIADKEVERRPDGRVTAPLVNLWLCVNLWPCTLDWGNPVV